MGRRSRIRLRCQLPGRLAALGLLAVALAAMELPAAAQVFVVGEKTATADVTTEFHATHVDLPTQPLDQRGRLDLIRNLEAEQGFAHRELPFGPGLELVANGNMYPSGEFYKQMLYQKGQAAAPGDRLEVSALAFKPDRIVIDFNGGPYAKHRFLSHIQINDVPIAQLGPMATGCRITLIFEGGVPELSAAEVKSLLDPIVDFKARTSAEAYVNTLSPVVHDAVQQHRILVGMDERMVLAALGEPHTKHREQELGPDGGGHTYNEWIYGQPPQPTQFVRFHDGRVVRLEIAALGKPLEVHEKNELGGPTPPLLRTRTIVNGDADQADQGQLTAARPPTLRRPGDPVEDIPTEGKVRLPVEAPTTPTTPTTPPASPPPAGTSPGTPAAQPGPSRDP